MMTSAMAPPAYRNKIQLFEMPKQNNACDPWSHARLNHARQAGILVINAAENGHYWVNHVLPETL